MVHVADSENIMNSYFHCAVASFERMRDLPGKRSENGRGREMSLGKEIPSGCHLAWGKGALHWPQAWGSFWLRGKTKNKKLENGGPGGVAQYMLSENKALGSSSTTSIETENKGGRKMWHFDLDSNSEALCALVFTSKNTSPCLSEGQPQLWSCTLLLNSPGIVSSSLVYCI